MDKETDFNFWPAFADLMLILVIVFVTFFFIVIKVINKNSLDISEIQRKQKNIISQISKSYNSKAIQSGQDSTLYTIYIGNSDSIFIKNDLKLQTYTFSDQILFDEGNYNLREVGKEVLNLVGKTIKDNIVYIKEIQIQGHADNKPVRKYRSNLELASLRSIEVFDFIRYDIGINPTENLMSATSFGEFKPVNRKGSDFDLQKLEDANFTQEKRDKNRRIELLLFYK